MRDKAVFLDRDGTIIEEVGYLSRISDIRLLEGAASGIKLLNQAGFKIIVVTNQSGVARGFFDEDFVHRVHQKISEYLNEQGAYIDAWYYCPHHVDGKIAKYSFDCSCRKPSTGMIEKACKDFAIDIKRSYVVGDSEKDILLAVNVGAKPVLVTTGYGRQTLNSLSPHIKDKLAFIVDNLKELALLICGY